MPRRQNTSDCARETCAEEVELRLFGFAPFSLNWDGMRLTSPAQLCERLGHHVEQEFVLSPWATPILRIIPIKCWPAYLDAQREAAAIHARASLMRLLEESCALRKLDSRRRWDIPTPVAESLGPDWSKEGVVLSARRFWLELRTATAWREYLAQNRTQIEAATSPPLDQTINQVMVWTSAPDQGFVPNYPNSTQCLPWRGG